MHKSAQANFSCARSVYPRILVAGLLIAASSAQAQWVTTYEQFYLQASHNWVFRNNYQAADRLFNAFDYGHAILYEKLWTMPDAAPSELEVKEYDFLTRNVLVRPPRVPLEEGAIEVRYVQLAPEAKQMFEWAHILHRQIYDVLADERLDLSAKDREVQRLIDYYRSRRDLAFSTRPKSMALMQEQPYSLAFRKQYPKFNGLIWGYHWLQVGLYEPLLVGKNVQERQSGVRATVSRFWQMLQDPPRTFPHQMPMTAAIAPKFAQRYPEAAIIFDNLHSMHDVISDILANDSVPRSMKRAEILLAAQRFRDDTSYLMTREAWQIMARRMGVENMGGPSVGFLPALPTPTVSYGAVMSHDDRTGEMTGFKYGEAVGDAHADHTGAATARADSPAAVRDSTAEAARSEHLKHGVARASADTAVAMLRALHNAMMRDSTIRARVMADSALRSYQKLLEAMDAVDSTTMPAATKTSPARRSGNASTPVTKSQPKGSPPKKKENDPHAGHAKPPTGSAQPPVKRPPRP